MRRRFLLRPLDSERKVARAAREFAEMMGQVVNCTISHAPITIVEVEDADQPTWYVAHCGPDKVPAPLPLVNGRYLYLHNLLSVRRKERYLATVAYRYAYQETEDPDSWIFRYEFLRDPPTPYPYAHSHLHVNASPTTYTGTKSFRELHLPTGRRVTIELIVRHLIVEHEVAPISPAWEATIEAGEAHFREVQRLRLRE